MATWYYYNESGEKIEVTGKELKQLALQGVITPETMIETEEGKTAPARRVKGLTFQETPSLDSKTSEPAERKTSVENVHTQENINAKDKNGLTLLHHAVCNNNIERISSLLDAGANIDEKDGNGNTALHLAAISNMGSVIKILLEAKANVETQNNDGKTALECAMAEKRWEIVHWLRKVNGGNSNATAPSCKTTIDDTMKTIPPTVQRTAFFKKSPVIITTILVGVLLAIAFLIIVCFSPSSGQKEQAFTILVTATFWLLIGIGIRQYVVFHTRNENDETKKGCVGGGSGCLIICILLCVAFIMPAIYNGVLTSEDEWKQQRAEREQKEQQRLEEERRNKQERAEQRLKSFHQEFSAIPMGADYSQIVARIGRPTEKGRKENFAGKYATSYAYTCVWRIKGPSDEEHTYTIGFIDDKVFVKEQPRSLKRTD